MKKLLAILLMLLPFTAHAIEIWEHEGGESYDLPFIRNTIDETLSFIGMEASDNFKALLLETMAAESGLGKAKLYGGGSYGVMQMTLPSAEWALKQAEMRFPQWHEGILRLRTEGRSLKEELRRNVPFSVCVAAIFYRLKIRGDREAKIKTRADRARIWKFYYNTSAGAGTEAGYLRQAKTFIWNQKCNKE